jgi:hypothetical protein
MLNVATPSVIILNYAECHYTESCYAECHYTES